MCLGYQLANLSAPTTDVTAAPAIERLFVRLLQAVVQTGGDSLLVTFDSTDGAVRSAVRVQRQIPMHDGEQPEDRAIRFRIGINIGDAIADGTDLHGDAVNIAARLQAECPPGGVCITRSVRDHVHGRLDLSFESLGALELKNISRPVEAFLLKSSEPTRGGSVKGADILQPDRPSIAVLPFQNMSGDPMRVCDARAYLNKLHHVTGANCAATSGFDHVRADQPQSSANVARIDDEWDIINQQFIWDSVVIGADQRCIDSSATRFVQGD
jgi:Adenylate and Guanylate cyclase catalytic domain